MTSCWNLCAAKSRWIESAQQDLAGTCKKIAPQMWILDTSPIRIADIQPWEKAFEDNHNSSKAGLHFTQWCYVSGCICRKGHGRTNHRQNIGSAEDVSIIITTDWCSYLCVLRILRAVPTSYLCSGGGDGAGGDGGVDGGGWWLLNYLSKCYTRVQYIPIHFSDPMVAW